VSHEGRSYSWNCPRALGSDARAGKRTVSAVREEIAADVLTSLTSLSSYFSNMTAFSLFSREILDNRLARTKSILDAEALLASIFSFAARFVATPSAETSDHTGSGTPAASHFATIASQRLRRAYTESEDLTPSLTLIQAYTLLSYFELTESVRPRSWRILGECVRIAYEIRLHAIDEDFDPDSDISAIGIDLEQWTMREEYRRAWWAIWEMDVFASTLRRLPTAIDWTQNFTLLPVPDSDWFSRSYQKSCFLASDPAIRWKDLTNSGNRSAKAWFILINSLMRNTQVLVFSARALALESSNAEQLSVELTLVSNALSCTSVSLPDELVYSGEMLNFENDPTDGAQLQADADKYSIHLMTQLSHVMINNYSVRARAPWANNTSKDSSHSQGLHSRASTAEWTKYLNAAEEIVKIVRNSNPRHYRHVNPFLVNTLWFAAAAQCSCRVFGPTSLTRQHRLAGSNLDLLQLTIDRFISFWGSTEKLKAKLARLERGLATLMQPRQKEHGDSSRSTQSHVSLQDVNAAPMLEPAGLDLLTANWDPVLGSEEDVYDENILHSFAGNFPFGLDDLIAFANA
jgi:hypothetical protein